MKFAQRASAAPIGMFVCMFLLLSTWGCPPAKPNPDGIVNPDGGVGDITQPLACEKGTLCIKVGNTNARGCDILLKNDKAIDAPQVSFDDSTNGQFKFRDTRLALSFIWKKDSGLAAGTFPVLLKLEAGVGKLAIASATCYDRKGARLDKAEVSLTRP